MKFWLSSALLLMMLQTSWADEFSGPGRYTLVREDWGTVFIDPSRFDGDYQIKMDKTGERYLLQRSTGEVVIEEQANDLKIFFPDLKVKVDKEPGHLNIQWGNKTYHLSRADHKMVFRGPSTEVTYTRVGDGLQIEGPQGKLTATGSEGTYLVESSAGTTRLQVLPDGLRVEGVRLSEHPYLRRRAVFLHQGVGLAVDWRVLDTRSPLFKLLEREVVLEGPAD